MTMEFELETILTGITMKNCLEKGEYYKFIELVKFLLGDEYVNDSFLATPLLAEEIKRRLLNQFPELGDYDDGMKLTNFIDYNKSKFGSTLLVSTNDNKPPVASSLKKKRR